MKIVITLKLAADVHRQLRQAEHYWLEFLEGGMRIKGDAAQTRTMRRTIKRWENALDKAKGNK